MSKVETRLPEGHKFNKLLEALKRAATNDGLWQTLGGGVYARRASSGLEIIFPDKVDIVSYLFDGREEEVARIVERNMVVLEPDLLAIMNELTVAQAYTELHPIQCGPTTVYADRYTIKIGSYVYPQPCHPYMARLILDLSK